MKNVWNFYEAKMSNKLHKGEDPAGYAKLANEGILLGYPVSIAGQKNRPDNGVGYHSSIKFFDPAKDHPHAIHNLAQHLPLNPPDAKNTQIEPGQFKDRLGNDVFVLKLKGNSADKIKEHNGKFAHMGFPANYEYTPHISVDKALHDKIKASGAKTAHEAGIEFGPAELKKGPKTLKTYHHKPDTTEPAIPDAGDFTSKVNVPTTKKVEKSEHPLEKGALKNALVGGAALLASHGAHAASGHLDQYVKGMGKLPGVKVESTFTPHKAGSQDGQGQYRIKVGNYTINGSHNSAGGINNHKTSMDGPKSPTSKDKQDEGKAQFLRHKLTTTGQDLLDKSELQKGALKNAGIALGMAGALASPTHATNTASRAPASIEHSQKSPYDHKKMLNAISQVESSGGKNLQHKPMSNGQHAFGRYALTPDTIRDTIKANPDLKAKHAQALALQGDTIHKYMQDHQGLEDTIADRHLAHLESHFKNNPDQISFGWLNGVRGTNRAKQNGIDFSKHWYTQKVKQAYGK